MAKYRKEKIKNGIKEITAMYIGKKSGSTSLITVTDVALSDDGKRATILVNAFPRDKENAACNFIKRSLGEIRKIIVRDLKINPVPFLDVKIDEGEKNRQKIDELLAKS